MASHGSLTATPISVWDWMNHETGKSCKLGREDTSLMQDMVAECLDMKRGTRKEETGKQHLERTDIIITKQRRIALIQEYIARHY